jgi:RnfABCDGE-type electron transport complex G subunit
MNDYIRLSVTLMVISGVAALLLSATNSATMTVISNNALIQEKEALKEVLPSADEFIDAAVSDKDIFVSFIKDKGLNPSIAKNGSLSFKIAKAGDSFAGMAFKLRPAGFSGPITMMVGIGEKTSSTASASSTEKTPVIAGLKILDHTETPGLGANVNEVKKELFEKICSLDQFGGMKELVKSNANVSTQKPWFQAQFTGLNKRHLKLEKDKGPVHAITAATISSRAVTDALSKAMDLYLMIKESQPQLFDFKKSDHTGLKTQMPEEIK